MTVLPSDGASPRGERGEVFASGAREDTGTLPADVSELVDRVDICERFGISRARFYQWAELPGFPAPVRTFGNGTRVWDLAAVEAWRASRR